MSNSSNDNIVENIQAGLEEMRTKITAYCDFKELFSKKNQDLLLKLKELLK